MKPRYDRIMVLCFYKYWARESGSTREYSDGIMISVEKLANVYQCFQAQMRRQINLWGYGWVGPRPHAYELCGWISQDGIIRRLKPGYTVN